MQDQFSVAVHFVKIVTDYMAAHGLACAPLLHQVGLDPAVLQNPNDRISFRQFAQLCQLTAESLYDPQFGLKLGQTIRPGHLGTHGIALMSCATVAELMQQHLRYSALTTDAIHTSIEKKANEYIRYTHTHVPGLSSVGMLLEQMDLAIVVTISRWFANRPDLNPNWVTFRHVRPSDVQEYQALFRCPISFSQAETAISISEEYVHMPLPHANPQLHRIMQDLCAQLLKQLGSSLEPAWVAKAQRAILESFKYGLPEFEVIAAQIDLSGDAFKEHLKQRGTSFREFVDNLRKDLALGYVRDPQLQLADISYLLGFSEQSAFQRAFKRWTGKTPGDYRKN